MAIRVQTQSDVNFGTMTAAVRVTHFRIQQNNNSNPVVKELSTPLEVEANRELVIPSGELDLVYPAGEFNNPHMNAIITPYYDGVTFKLDAMTDENTVVSVGGYSQQTYSDWQISSEDD